MLWLTVTDRSRTVDVTAPPSAVSAAAGGQMFLRRSGGGRENSESPPRVAQRSVAPVPVLVVEDNPDVREIITALVARAGRGLFVAGQASNCDEAVELADEVEPDIVVLDYLLPGSDGLETATKLRAEGFDGQIVLCTGYSQDLVAKRRGYEHVDVLVSKDRLKSLAPTLRSMTADV